MGWECPCGFDPHCEAEMFSAEWYAAHRDWHVAAFPTLDARSIHNLEEAIEWAS